MASANQDIGSDQELEEERQRARRAADPSNWSPQLRDLIREKFPEDTREERIRRATQELRSVTLGENLPLESVRFYAEELELDSDF
jgi:hypothetical protein